MPSFQGCLFDSSLLYVVSHCCVGPCPPVKQPGPLVASERVGRHNIPIAASGFDFNPVLLRGCPGSFEYVANMVPLDDKIRHATSYQHAVRIGSDDVVGESDVCTACNLDTRPFQVAKYPTVAHHDLRVPASTICIHMPRVVRMACARNEQCVAECRSQSYIGRIMVQLKYGTAGAWCSFMVQQHLSSHRIGQRGAP